MEINSNFLKVTIWVTEACNLRCIYCYEGREKGSGCMSLDMANKVIDWIYEEMKRNRLSFLFVRFHGGEPMLNFPIIEYIISRVNENTCIKSFFEMTTNGVNISDSQIEFICKYIDDLSVSVDGLKEIHDKYRIDSFGNGSYESVMECVNRIRLLGKDFSIRMTLNAADVSLLEKSITHFVQAGFVNIAVLVNVFDEYWSVDDLAILKNECKIIREKYALYEESISLPMNMIHHDIGNCTGGMNSYQIMPNGDMYPCPFLIQSRYCIGNISSGVSEYGASFINSVLNSTVEMCEGCGGYRTCVNTKCKYLTISVNGDINEPLPLICELTRQCLI